MTLLIHSGPVESVMVLVPEAYESIPDLDQRPDVRDFYDYYAGLQVSGGPFF